MQDFAHKSGSVFCTLNHHLHKTSFAEQNQQAAWKTTNILQDDVTKKRTVYSYPSFNLILYSIYGPIVPGQIYTDALSNKGMFIRNKMSMVKWHLSVSVLKASRPSAVLALLCLALLSDLGPSIKYVCIRGRR